MKNKASIAAPLCERIPQLNSHPFGKFISEKCALHLFKRDKKLWEDALEKGGKRQKEAEDILEEVCGALSRGETVKLSSFGTFQVRQKSERVGRNPKTGDEVPIAPRRVLVFRPSHVLKAQINGLETAGLHDEG